jgi:hypothetical protein
MHPQLEHTLADLRRDGPRRFARWNAELFDAVVSGPAHTLGEGLGDSPDSGPVLCSYLQLVQQAIGVGVLQQAGGGSRWATFLERCLMERIPALLPRVKAGARLPLLVKLWNLGEGLQREPAWLDRYVTACAGRLDDLADVEDFLVRTLNPVLASAPPAAWRGPFVVMVLDLRPLYEEFLPGEIGLAAPTVLRIEDRRQSGMQVGVFLRRQGGSEIIGLTDGLGDYMETGEQPTVKFGDGRAEIAAQTVNVPFLRRCHRHAIANAGFVAACAVDSQRLWIVESA